MPFGLVTSAREVNQKIRSILGYINLQNVGKSNTGIHLRKSAMHHQFSHSKKWRKQQALSALRICLGKGDLVEFIKILYGLDRKIQEGVKSGSGPKRNIRLLKANYIKEFTFLSQGEDPLDISKCFLDLNTLQAREDSAIRQAEIDAERIGVGVGAEAQSIFDALAKTLPVRWDKTNIVVMNEVRVSSPYLPENVTGGTPAANERVRKVLEFEKKRLQARSAGQ